MIRTARIMSVCFGLSALTASVAFAKEKQADAGAALFTEKCAPCHQADGAGAPGAFPSLKGTLTHFQDTDAGHVFLSHLLLTGMTGPIDQNGQKFNGVMPPFASLDDKSITSILRYVLVTFNGAAGKWLPSEDDIAKARQSLGSASATRSLRTAAHDAK